jgi:hypothetical protein
MEGRPSETEITANNTLAIEKIEREVRTHFTDQEFWIVNVPSSSEEVHTHTPWDRREEVEGDQRKRYWVEPEYRERLRAAYRLLVSGVVRYIFISGGAIDEHHAHDFLSHDGTTWPYIDAMFGRQHLIENFQAHWDAMPRGDDDTSLLTRDADRFTHGQFDSLESRIIVDNYALHTESNVRNCDRLCALLGLDRNLIATTFSKNVLPGVYGQGDGFCNLPFAELFTQVSFWCKFSYWPGSFNRLSVNQLLNGRETLGGGTGIFGNASLDYPGTQDALLRPRPFTAYALDIPSFGIIRRLSQEEAEIGIILHDKLDLNSLRHDTRAEG